MGGHYLRSSGCASAKSFLNKIVRRRCSAVVTHIYFQTFWLGPSLCVILKIATNDFSPQTSSISIIRTGGPVVHLPLGLEFVAKLAVPDQSIFYSGFFDGKFVHLFGRATWRSRAVTYALVHPSNFSVVSCRLTDIRAEDPRFFIFNGRKYLIDNYLHNVTVICMDSLRYVQVDLPGKNFVWFEEDGELFVIHRLKPLTVYKINPDTGFSTLVNFTKDPGSEDPEYRGGTPLVKVNSSFEFGLGHRTIDGPNWVIHDPFMIRKNDHHVDIIPVRKPPSALRLMDPACIIQIYDYFYLVTAESSNPWWYPQDYRNLIYRIL
jgi:hypothetical protein